MKNTTISNIKAVTKELVALGYGHYAVIAQIPVSSGLFGTRDSYHEFLSINNKAQQILVELHQYNSGLHVPEEEILKAARNGKPTKGYRNVDNNKKIMDIYFLNEILDALIERGFGEFDAHRLSHKDMGTDAFGFHFLGRPSQVDADDKRIYFILGSHYKSATNILPLIDLS